MASEIPWQQDTRQAEGRKIEKPMAKKYNARVHPASGARGIKSDFSDDETVYEMKLAAKTHTLNGQKLNAQLIDAIGQGKDAVYIVYFDELNLTLEATLRRGN